jgi:FtsP/CotA-like multicopper oxidase with cupredoxin domain
MKHLLHVIVLIVALLPTLAFGQACTGTNIITDPEAFVWDLKGAGTLEEHYTGVLEIGEESFTIGGDTITTRVYRQPGLTPSIPGPTLHMEAGKKYVLQFRNKLPYEPKLMEHNVFKDPNVSNLHTHGLHISGETPGDDVTRSFEGTGGGDFVYDIPADHMGGSFWYHAHHHGSTFLQVSAGAFGMIVIDNQTEFVPATVAEMEERELVVAYLDPDVAGTGGDTLISGTLAPTWTVNGKVGGDLCIPPDTWQHWRVLLADRDAKEKTVSIGNQCEVQLMARDGVWRTEVPKEITTGSLSLTGASRADLAVRCSGDSSISVGSQVVANIFTSGTPGTADAHPWDTDGESTWFSERPGYLRDLRGETDVNTETVNMGARTINGNKFDKATPTFTLDSGKVEAWKLKGARNHPFHLHIYHVQIDGDCGSFEDGEYYDVVSGNCNIRFDLNSTSSTPYYGRTIMHCHILEHEDQGAMGWAQVVNGTPAPTFPEDFGYQADYPPIPPGGDVPAAPSGLLANALSSSEIQLDWVDNSNDEDLFDIERRSGGGSFSWIHSVNADTTSYVDEGLAASTTYDYRVSAENSYGTSAFSNIDSATTDLPGTATLVRVRSITVSTVGTGKGFKTGRAVVVVEDDQSGLVENADVTGTFSGSFTENNIIEGPTAADGSVTFDTSDPAVKGKVNLDFCVTFIESNSTLADYTGPEVCGSL